MFIHMTESAISKEKHGKRPHFSLLSAHNDEFGASVMRTLKAINNHLFTAGHRSLAPLKRQLSTVPAQQAVLVL